MEIKLDDQGLRDAFKRLGRYTNNFEPALKEMGEYYHGAVDERFRQERDHKGQPWKRLSPRYAAWKARQPTAIQKKNQLTGIMRAGMNYRTNRTEMKFGSDRVYASVRNKDRPFINPSSQDISKFTQILKERAADAWRGVG